MTRRSFLRITSLFAIIAIASLTSFALASQDSFYAWSEASDLSEHESFKLDVDAASEWRIMTATGGSGSGTGGTGTTGTGGTGTTGTGLYSSTGANGYTPAMCNALATSVMPSCVNASQSLRCSIACGAAYGNFYSNCIATNIANMTAYPFVEEQYADFNVTCGTYCSAPVTDLFLSSCHVRMESNYLVYPREHTACTDACGNVRYDFFDNCLIPSFDNIIPANFTAYNALCTITAPGDITSLSLVAVSANSISISWSQITGTGSNVTYVLQRYSDVGPVTIYTGIAPTFLDTGLTTNTSYSYRVRAYNRAGNNTFSDYEDMTTLLLPPASPASITVNEVGLDFITVSWTAVTGRDSTMYYQVSVDGIPMYYGTETEATIGSLKAFTYYLVSVTASTIGSAFSDAANVTVRTIDEVPTPVFFLPIEQQIVRPDEIILHWSRPTFCGGFTSCDSLLYIISTNATNTTNNTYVIGSQSTIFTCLTYATVYQFTISAENSVGRSVVSNVLYISTPAIVPSPPAAVNFNAVSDNSATVVWNTNVLDGGSRILGADLQVYAHNTTIIYNVNFWAGSFILKNLTSATIYMVNIRARNAVGVSYYSNFTSFTTLLPAPKVLLFFANSANGLNQNTEFRITFDQDVQQFAVSTKENLDSVFDFVPAIPATNYTGEWINNATIRITIPMGATVDTTTPFSLGFSSFTFKVFNIGVNGTSHISNTYRSPVLTGSFYSGVVNIFTSEVYNPIIVNQDSVNNSMSIPSFTGTVPANFDTFTLRFAVRGHGSLSIAENAPAYTNVAGVISFAAATTTTMLNIVSFVKYAPQLYSLDNAVIIITALGANNAQIQTSIPISMRPVPHAPQIIFAGTINNLIMGTSAVVGPFRFADIDDRTNDMTYVLSFDVTVPDAYLIASSFPIDILPLGSTNIGIKSHSIIVSGTLYALMSFVNNSNVRYFDDSLIATTSLAQVNIHIAEVDGSLQTSIIQQYSPVCAGSSAPSMSGATFCSDYTCIFITFTSPVDTSLISSVNCSAFFTEAVVSRFGGSSSCVFQTRTTMQITLGANAKIMPAESLVLAASNGIRRCPESSSASGSVVVAAPSIVALPRVEISGIPLIGVCDGIDLLTETSNTASRAVSYSWTSNIISVLPYLPATGSSASAVSLNNGNLVAGTTYIFTVTIKDFLNRTTSSSYTVTKSQNKLPTIRVIGGTTVTNYASDVTLVQVEPVLNTCANDRRMSFRWNLTTVTGSVVPIEASRNGKPSFSLPANSLNVASSPYTLSIVTSMVTDASLSTTTRFTINIIPTPLQVLIEGGFSRIQSATSTLNIRAILSDYDNSATAATYVWTCRTSAGISCTDATSNQALTFGSGSTLAVTANTLSVGIYTFSVSVSKPGRATVTAMTSINIVAAAVPSVIVSTRTVEISDSGILRLTASVSDSSNSALTYVWSLVSGSLAANTSQPNPTTYIVNPNGAASAFTPGATYTFRLSVTNNLSLTGYSDVSIRVRTPPSGGVISISPSSGTALLTDFAWSTSGWSSTNAPLTYTFYTVTNGVSIQQSRGATIGAGRLSASGTGGTRFVVRVCDRFGSCSEASSSVTVAPTTASTTQLTTLLNDAVDSSLSTSDIQRLLSLLCNIFEVARSSSTPSRRLLQTTSLTDAIQNIFNNPSVMQLFAQYADREVVFKTAQQFSEVLLSTGAAVREFGNNAILVRDTLESYAGELFGDCDSVNPTACQVRRVILNAASSAALAAYTALPDSTATTADDSLGVAYVGLIQSLDSLYASYVLSSAGDIITPIDAADISNYIRRDDFASDVSFANVVFPAGSLANATDSANLPINNDVSSIVSVFSKKIVSTFSPLDNIVVFERKTSSGSAISFTSQTTAIIVTFLFSTADCDIETCAPTCVFSSNSSMVWESVAESSTPTLLSPGLYQITCSVSNDVSGAVTLAPRALVSPSDDSSDNSLALGLGIGLGVGGALIIVAVLAYFFIVRKSQTVVPQGNTETLTSSV